MLAINDIHTWYGDSYVLQGVDMEVKDGTVVALLGRNGMGKTTTIRSIIGLTPPRKGSITFNGTELVGLAARPDRAHGHRPGAAGPHDLPVAVRHREPHHGRAHRRQARTRGRSRRCTRSSRVSKERGKNKGNLLSGGEQQMLTIARALMTNPDLIMLDEPSEGLAPIVVQEVYRVIEKLKAAGQSILLVEQDFGMAMSVADYAYIMSKGSIVYGSAPADLIDNETVKAQYLGVGVPTTRS